MGVVHVTGVTGEAAPEWTAAPVFVPSDGQEKTGDGLVVFCSSEPSVYGPDAAAILASPYALAAGTEPGVTYSVNETDQSPDVYWANMGLIPPTPGAPMRVQWFDRSVLTGKSLVAFYPSVNFVVGTVYDADGNPTWTPTIVEVGLAPRDQGSDPTLSAPIAVRMTTTAAPAATFWVGGTTPTVEIVSRGKVLASGVAYPPDEVAGSIDQFSLALNSQVAEWGVGATPVVDRWAGYPPAWGIDDQSWATPMAVNLQDETLAAEFQSLVPYVSVIAEARAPVPSGGNFRETSVIEYEMEYVYQDSGTAPVASTVQGEPGATGALKASRHQTGVSGGVVYV